MAHDFTELLDLIAAMDDAPPASKPAAQAAFDAASKEFIRDLLSDGGDPDEIIPYLTADLDTLATQPGANALRIARLREALLAQFADRARRNARRRAIFAAVPIALIFLIVFAYFGWRISNIITIDQPVETRAGLTQRAAALEKVLRYDDYHLEDVLRWRFLFEIAAWPTKPSAAEIKGAEEFVEAAVKQGQGLEGEGPHGPVACSIDTHNELGLTMAMSNIAHRIRSPGMKWRDPPLLALRDTVLAYECPNYKAMLDGTDKVEAKSQ